MIQNLAGIPAHPLFVHLTVVGVPVAALLLLLWAVVAPWRTRLALPTVVISAAALVSSLVSKSTGEALVPALGYSEHEAGPVTQHALYADLMVIGMGLGFGLSVLMWAAQRWLTTDRFPRSTVLLSILRVLSVLVAVYVLVTAVLTGHAGAQLVWSDFPSRPGL